MKLAGDYIRIARNAVMSSATLQKMYLDDPDTYSYFVMKAVCRNSAIVEKRCGIFLSF